MARAALWGGSCFGAAGGDLQYCFGWKDDSGVILQDRRRSVECIFSGVKYKQLVRIVVDRCFSGVKLVYKGHAVEDGSRLLDVRGERLSGSVMERTT